MERELVTIRTISKLIPIEKADFIELAEIDGWRVIVRKGSFNKGDLCVYFEIDSFLPIDKRYEFLCKSSYRNDQILGEGFRIKTMKMRGVLSQGLALPLNEFPEINIEKHSNTNLSSFLNVKKWNKELSISVNTNNNFNKFKKYLYKYFPFYTQIKNYFKFDNSFPTHFVSKTSATRIQNIRDLDHNILYEQTLKLHGTSLTIIKQNGKPIICSRNQRINPKDKTNLYMIEGMKIFNKIKDFNEDIVLQGELCGPGINGNTNNLDKIEFFVFNIRYLNSIDFVPTIDHIEIFCDKHFISCVPVINYDYNISNKTIPEILDEANNLKSLNDTNAEGFVLRPHNSSQKIKVISNNFLLQNES